MQARLIATLFIVLFTGIAAAQRPSYEPPRTDKPIADINLDETAATLRRLAEGASPAPAVGGISAVEMLWRNYRAAKSVDAALAREFVHGVLDWQDRIERSAAGAAQPLRHGFMPRPAMDGQPAGLSLLDGSQLATMAAVAWQMVQAFPEAFADPAEKELAIVRFVDATPPLDGKWDDAYSEITGHVAFAADPLNLTVFLDVEPKTPVDIFIYEGPEKGERWARLQIAADGAAAVISHERKMLVSYMKFGKQGTEVQIPWPAVRGQGDWFRPSEGQRGVADVTLGIGEKFTTRFVMLSTPQRMQARLRAMVEGVIANQAGVLKERGYLPTMPSDTQPSPAAAASLLEALEQYRLAASNQRDWQRR